MASIACEDCTHHRHRVPSNTKYCKKCRLLRDVEFWAGKTRRCRTENCDGVFCPVHRLDLYCGNCVPGQTANLGTCQLCRRDESYLLMRDVKVCERCARDPDLRKRFISGLRKGQRERRANPPTEPLRQPQRRTPANIEDELANAPVI